MNTTEDAARAVKNMAQTLTSDQQGRSFFSVVASGLKMADGTTQTPYKAKVRMRNGDMTYVKDLPEINKDDPQPNGDYHLPLQNNHWGTVEDQSGALWLFIKDDMLHGLVVFSDNKAAENLLPLARDGFLQFSTEGYVEDISESGEYGDFWITAVAPVTVGNDPATQVVEHRIKELEGVINSLSEKIATMSGADAPTESIQTNEADDSAESEDDMSMSTVPQVAEPQAKPTPVPSVANAVPVPEQGAMIAVTNTGREWLKTTNAMTEFVSALKLGSAERTRSAWESSLVENGITFDPDEITLLPEALVTEIDTVITTNGEIYNKLNHTGLMYVIVGTSEFPLESAKVRARGASGAKASQDAEINPRIIQATSFYKYLSQAYDMIARNGGLSGAIARFATRELAMKVLELIERAVVVGGVNDDSGAAISPQFVTPISSDTTAGGVYGDIYTQGATESIPEAITSAAAGILSGGNVTYITTRARAAKLPYMTVGEAGIPMFLNSAERGSVNIPMVNDVISPIWLTEADLGGGIGYLVDLGAYKTVGETGTAAFYQFHLRTNEHDFEAIKMFGGALSKYRSAVKLMPAATTQSAQVQGVAAPVVTVLTDGTVVTDYADGTQTVEPPAQASKVTQ